MERVSGTTEASESSTSPFPEMQSRLASYGVSALAVAGLLAAPADAGIISYTAPANLDATNGSPILFDFLTGAATNSGAGPSADTFELSVKSQISGYTSSGQHFTTRSVHARATGLGGLSKVAGSSSAYRFAKNSVIDGSLSFTKRAVLFSATFNEQSGVVDNTSRSGRWFPTGDDAYLGFEFLNGAATDFGWAEVAVNADSTLTLKAFGYDNTGAAIPAGETGSAGGATAPDADPLLLLVVGGSVGLAAYRGRRREGAVVIN